MDEDPAGWWMFAAACVDSAMPAGGGAWVWPMGFPNTQEPKPEAAAAFWASAAATSREAQSLSAKMTIMLSR